MLAPKTPQRERRKKEKQREVGRRYFIATEGLSESEYMTGIKNMLKPKKGKVISIDVTVIKREKSIKDMSDPKFNVTYLRDYVRAVTMTDDGKDSDITGALFVASVLTGLITDREPHITTTDSSIPNEFFNEATKVVEESSACDEKRRVIDYEMATEVLKSYLSGKGVADEYLRDFKYPHYDQLFIEDRDKLCLIVDRDYSKKKQGANYEARDEEYYNELRKLCRKDLNNTDILRKVDLYVTNPSIEFWFLLHFDGFMDRVKAYEESELARNEKNTEGKNLAEVLLDKVYMEKFGIHYKKSDINFDRCLRNGVRKAIENSQSYEESLAHLENSLGSNLRYLLQELGVNPKEDLAQETIRTVQIVHG